MNERYFLRCIPWVALLVAAACSGGSSPTTIVSGSTSGNSSGSSAVSGTGTTGGTSVTMSGQTGQTGGSTSPSSGTTTAAPGSGSTSTPPTSGTTSGTGGASGSSSGASTGAANDAGGSGPSTDASGVSSDSGVTGNHRHGMSMGCGNPPNGANSNGFTNHKLPIPKCTNGCTAAMGNCPRTCIAPEFAPGGVSDQEVGGENFTLRDFSIMLPKDYDTSTPYPVFMGGGGCGGGPPQNGNGYGINETGAIQVGLGYILRCFADGGSACSGSDNNEALCINGPEIPYVQFVLNWVESNFCVDLSKEFIGGGSSGGWEAMTNGCGNADLLRGFVSVSGGKREHQWPCMGPMAGLMVVNGNDTANPIGQPDQPNVPFNKDLDSWGSAHERLDLLMRNACVGTATAMYNPAFPDCMTYTGCPAAFPVVWCDIANGGHDNTQDGNTNYINAMWPFLTGLPAEP